jgi:hypothetical protein
MLFFIFFFFTPNLIQQNVALAEGWIFAKYVRQKAYSTLLRDIWVC